MATGDLSNPIIAADGTTWTVDIDGLDGDTISQIEDGKAVTVAAGGATIPLSFASAADVTVPGSTIFEDTFTDTNGTDITAHTPETDPEAAGWVDNTATAGGDVTIGGNGTQMVCSGAPTNRVIPVFNSGTANGTFTAKIHNGTATNRAYQIIFRYVDDANYLFINIKSRAADIGIWKIVGGVSIQVGSSYTSFTTLNSVHTWVLTMDGDNISLSADDNVIFTDVAVSDHSTATLHGAGWNSNYLEPFWTQCDFATVGVDGARITLSGDSQVLSGESPTLSADVGAFDDGINTSLVASDVSATNNSTQTAETSIDISSITLTDTDTMAIVLTASSVCWGTLTFDVNDINVWAVSGYGHPGIATSSVSGDGTLTATVTLNFDRTIKTNEIIDLETLTGWLACSRGNTGKVDWRIRGADLSNGASPPATTTTVSHERTSITLGSAATVGFYLDGVPYIVDSGGGNTITAETPTRTTFDTDAVHGAAHNPAFWNTQPFDQRASGYNASNLPSLPVSVDAGDSYVKAYSQSDADYTSIDGASVSWPSHIRSFGCYHFASSIPGATEIAPPVWGYDGAEARPTLTIDVSTILASLPSKTLTGLSDSGGTPRTAPDKTDSINRICQPNIGRVCGENDFSRHLVPTYFTSAEGYGQDQSQAMSNMMVHIMGDEATNAEKIFMIKWLAHHGSQLYWSQNNRGTHIPENGGLEQGYLAAVVAALNWTGNTGELSTLQSVLGMNELRQTYAWTQTDIDRYNNLHQAGDVDGYPLTGGYSYYSRRHTVASTSDETITLDSLHQYYFENAFGAMQLTDGTTTWEVVSHTRYAESLTIDTAAHGLSPNDQVWLRFEYDGGIPTIGTPDWGITHKTEPQRTFPSASGTYRALNVWSMQVLFLEFLRYHTGFGHDAWRDECRAVNADVNYLSVTQTANKRHETNFANAFWTAYQADAQTAAETSTGGPGLLNSPFRF